MKDEVTEFCFKKLDEGCKIKTYIHRLDTDNEYDATIGVYNNGELIRLFELENVTNSYLDKYEEILFLNLRKKKLRIIGKYMEDI